MIGSRRHGRHRRHGRNCAGLLTIAVVAVALGAGAVPLAAQIPRAPQVPDNLPAAEDEPASALAQIDRLAARAALFLHRQVPDRAGETIWLLPFLTDTGAATRLGHRLQSAVHLRLLRHYRSAQIRLVERHPLPFPAPAEAEPRLPSGAASAPHALVLEIQPFRDTVRVIMRVLALGEARAGDWIDLPANDELRELLDRAGSGAGAAPPHSSEASPGGTAAVLADAPRPPLPDAITVDRGQQRYTTAGGDWVALQVPAPGFFVLDGRSFAGPLTLSLHYDRGGPAVVTAREDAPTVAGGDADGLPRGVDRKIGFFSGPKRSYAHVGSASEDQVAYYLRLRPLSPGRRFADGTEHEVPLERGTGFQTLRVFRSGTYRAGAAVSAGTADLRVFSVPEMRGVAPLAAEPPLPPRSAAAPAETNLQRYELAAGDYLIEVTSAPVAQTARLCWAAADAASGSNGCTQVDSEP